MELRNCEYCGTAYDARLSQCPLCGRTAGGQKAPAQPEPKRVRPAAENKPEKIQPTQPDSPARTEKAPAGKRLRQEPGGARAARGYTGRDKIVKFIGCYHGHGDSLLVKAGSGAATFGQPDSPGVTAGTAKDTLTVAYNDADAFRELMDRCGDDIAAVIVEPIAGNMGLVLPEEGYLQLLRDETQKHGTVLIFDEVMCGFRTALHGAQSIYHIVPDMTTLGKIIGGGLPVAAYGGRKDIMDCVSPAGPVYQAGTLSGNPLAMAAGLETLRLITEDPDYIEKACAKTKILTDGLKDAAAQAGAAVQVHRAGTMFSVFFSAVPVTNYATSEASDQDAFRRYFLSMLEQGIYLAPSQFETNFVSGAHSDEDIARTVNAAETAFRAARG